MLSKRKKFWQTGPAPYYKVAGYVGPGDVVSGALGFWGGRGYNAAYCTGSNPAIDVVDTATGLITTTINIKTDGSLDVATIIALGYAVSVKKFYDQTGHSLHLDTQATLAKMPTFVNNAIGSLPGFALAGATFNGLQSTNSLTQAQPWGVSAVAKRTGNNTSYGAIFGSDSAGQGYFVGFGNSTNTATIYAGTVYKPAISVSDGSFHALQYTANGASSSIYVDGSAATAGDASTGAIGDKVSGGFVPGNNEGITAIIGEIIVYGLDLTASSRQSNLNSNQRAYWGF